jgi:hypothetical protein
MAEKKFFVDINLQGSALTNAKIGTNTGIGSTEGAFGYDSSAHRLQYFDGTATKEVANLSDIAAVTGGLILQGGYDANNNAPNITGGTALKGFFWVVTETGSFLGESVQIGDSIIAKIDEAGATPVDWLILQGNVVIATDTVDGISRLATQTEANAGTEGGAVVITPATLQGKIDTQITPEISSKLPLAGGSMSGPINMADNNITNANAIYGANVLGNQIDVNILTGKNQNSIVVKVPLDFENNYTPINLLAPTEGGDAANKLYVDTKLGLAGGTMSGDIDMNGKGVYGANIVSSTTVISDNISASDNINPINVNNNLNFNGNKLPINLTAPTNDGDAANKSYVDTTASTAQANAEATASADATTKANAAQAAAEAYADSLAPNYDAAGSAAQALTDANAYTDTRVDALNYSTFIQVNDWVLDEVNGGYYYIATHNLNTYSAISGFLFSNSGEYLEFASEMISENEIKVKSNMIPVSQQFPGGSITATFYKGRI